jgi:pimeloyl-ACP methyl ester carboxylesterase
MRIPLHRILGRLAFRRAAWLVPALLIGLAGSGRGAEGPVQPPVACIPQNAGVPGSYPHQQVCHTPIGAGGNMVWVFYPDAPRPPVANVVVFLHGYRATDPVAYGGWIDHLVRMGNIVLYPVFEAERGDPPEISERHALDGVRAAIASLQQQGPVKPSFDGFSVVGHSFGGGMAVQFAAMAAANGLPQPKAVMAVMPGWEGGERYPADTLNRVPPSTYVLIVDGDSDQFASTRESSNIFRLVSQIPAERKAMIRLVSGGAAVADHYAPLSPLPAYRLEQRSASDERRREFVMGLLHVREGEINALDTQALWPMFDQLIIVGKTNGNIGAAVRAAALPVL